MKFLNKIASNPYRDWFSIVMISVLLSGVLIFVGAYAYLDVGKRLGADLTAVSGSVSTVFNMDMLKNVLRKYEARSMETTLLESGYNGIGDPSI